MILIDKFMSQKIHFMFQRVFMPAVRYGVERLKTIIEKGVSNAQRY